MMCKNRVPHENSTMQSTCCRRERTGAPPLYSALLCSTLLYSALLCSTLIHSTLLFSTLPYSTIHLWWTQSPRKDKEVLSVEMARTGCAGGPVLQLEPPTALKTQAPRSPEAAGRKI